MTTKTHLNKSQSINLGSFYTPPFVVNIAYRMLLNSKMSTKDYILLDSSCGYGYFLQTPKDIKFKQKIGADIDKIALQKAEENLADSMVLQDSLTTNSLQNSHILLLQTNSLQNISREKFAILPSSPLLIIGNPPYNDKTSITQKHLKNTNPTPIDSNLKARDIGISFLRSFDVLKADYICVLHPLSYLIKKSNFKSLKNFTKNYRLLDSVVISSSVFCPKSLGYFPIIIAFYKRDGRGMDYEFIRKFCFKTYEGKSFKLESFDFIAKYIDKYPNKSRVCKSQKIAMFYTLRDINALRRSKTFIKKENANTLYVEKEKYSLYCYVDVFKHFIPHIPYYLGNCDILINFEKFKALESSFIKASQSKEFSPEIRQYFKDLLGEHYED